MKDLLKKLGAFFWEVLKELDWKKVLYKAYIDVVQPKLRAYVTDTENKWDDVMVSGLDRIVDVFLNPDGGESEA